MFKTLEKTFAVAMLFYTTGATLTYFIARVHGFSGLAPSRIELLIQAVFYCAGLFFMAVHWRNVVQSAIRVKWILALLAVTLVSTGWSQDPSTTLRHSLVLCATTAFAIYLATRFELHEQLRLLAWTCALVIIASLLFVIFLPRFGVDQTVHIGDWQGAFYQKNMLARSMVLSVLVFLFVRFRPSNPLRWIGLLGSLALLALSRSVTGLLVCAAILISLPAYKIFRTRFSFGIPVVMALTAAATAVAAAAYLALPSLLQLLHRDVGLTGRLELWDAVLMAISKRPWLGYGFSAFWQGFKGESANVLLAVKWSPGYAHNGFLDLVLDTGLAGLGIFLAGYFYFWWKAVALVSRTSGRLAFWICGYLLFVLFYNLTEGPALSQNNISWVLYVATAVNLSLYLPAPSEKRVEAPEPAELQPAEEGAVS